MRTKLAAYDNGYGLVISEFIGDECHAMDRIPGDKFRIKMPETFTDKNWDEQRKLVNEMVDAYNEKWGLK